MDQHIKDEGKTTAIISYITIIGLIVALIMNSSKQNAFAKYHIGQSVRLFAVGVINSILGFFLPASLSIITTVIGLCLLVLMIIGIINAANGQEKPLPVIGTIG